MKHSLARWIALLATLFAAPGAAFAADHGWYLGAAYTDISPDFPSTYNPLTVALGQGTVGEEGFEIYGGYRAFDWLAIEASYNDFGDSNGTTSIICVASPCPTHFSASTEAYTLSALGLYSIRQFDLFARVGITGWSAEAELLESGVGHLITQDDSDSDVSFGAGGQFHFNRMIARLAYEHFRFGGGRFGDTDADVWSLGLAWSFR